MRQPPLTRWVEVDPAALRHNLRSVRSLLPPGCRLMAVVKANGYGHGLAPAAQAFAEARADALGVTTLEEGAALRAAGLGLPVLVFAPCLPGNAEMYLELKLAATVACRDAAEALSQAAVRARAECEVHLKVDTGMGRVGVLPSDAPALAASVVGLPGLRLEAVYTHLAAAQDPRSAALQLARFEAARAEIAAQGVHIPTAHAANSAALLLRPEARLDLVRPGTLLYGQYPLGVPRDLDLRSGWRFLARLLQVKLIPKGWTVSYGQEFVAPREMRVGVLAAGYADGFGVSPDSLWRGTRGLRRWVSGLGGHGLPTVKVRGQRVPVLGRVAAQMCVVDLSGVPDAQAGDIAELHARRTQVGEHIPRLLAPSDTPPAQA